MALTETLAHLEELRTRGLARRERRGDVLFYAASDAAASDTTGDGSAFADNEPPATR
jgi:hypothetical protein